MPHGKGGECATPVPHRITSPSPSASASLFILRMAAHGWPPVHLSAIVCVCSQPKQAGGEGGGCMVCSENYFSTATGLIMVGTKHTQ